MNLVDNKNNINTENATEKKKIIKTEDNNIKTLCKKSDGHESVEHWRYIFKYVGGIILPCFITGIGGYDNTWRQLDGNFYWCRSHILWTYRLNYHIPYKLPFTNWEIDLHIAGINLLSSIICVLLYI